MLTKSLHTVTAVTNVAQYIWALPHAQLQWGAFELCERALGVLGYSMTSFTPDDPTVQRCITACGKIISASRAKAAA